MRALYVLLCLVAFAVPLSLPELSAGPFVVDAALLSLGIALLLALLFLSKDDSSSPFRIPYLIPFLIFLISGVASSITAYDPLQSVQMLMRYIAYFVLVLIAVAVLTSLRRIQILIALILAAAVISTAFGFFMYLFHPEVIQVGAWELGDEITNRVAGTFPDANWFGEFMVLSIPVGIGLMMAVKNWWLRGLLAGSVAFATVGLLMSYSRGSWLSLAVGLVVLVFMIDRRLLAPLAAVGAAIVAVVPGFMDRISSLTDLTQGTAGFRSRLWGIYLAEFTDRPVLGTGLGNVLEAFSHYNFTHPVGGMITPPFSAHNYYLGTLVETGALGFIALLVLLVLLVRVGLTIAASTGSWSPERVMNAGIVASLLGYFANGMTSSLYTHPRVFIIAWLMVGLQAALWRVTRTSPQRQENAAEPVTSARPLLAGSAVYRWLTSAHEPRIDLSGSSVLLSALAGWQSLARSAMTRAAAGSRFNALLRRPAGTAVCSAIFLVIVIASAMWLA